jgi:transcriptional regulator with XRE-family HTH domain
MIEPMAEAGISRPETVGQRLKRLRLERGLSQRELAAPGVTYAYISRIETGTRQPSVKALRKLAVALGVTADFLETGSDLASAEARELRLADLELGIRLGESGDAETQLATILEESLAAGDRGSAAHARLSLVLVADERGDHASAVEHFEEACALERPSAVDHVGVFVTIGRAYGALGAVDREIALYEECIDEVVRLGAEATSTMIRYRIRLSYALSDAGEFKRAEQMLREALKSDAAGHDRYMRIRVFWSLARLSEMEGRSKAALRYARRAIALLEETEDDLQRARAYLLAAWIMNSAGDPNGANSQLERAEHILGDGAPVDDLAILKVEKARMEALLGNGDAAVGLAGEAIAIVGDQHGATLGTAYWALAAGLALQGDIDAASDAFMRSLSLLEKNHRWREATEASRAWAQVLRDAGRPEQALDVLDRSAGHASHLLLKEREAQRASSSRKPSQHR